MKGAEAKISICDSPFLLSFEKLFHHFAALYHLAEQEELIPEVK